MRQKDRLGSYCSSPGEMRVFGPGWVLEMVNVEPTGFPASYVWTLIERRQG